MSGPVKLSDLTAQGYSPVDTQAETPPVKNSQGLMKISDLEALQTQADDEQAKYGGTVGTMQAAAAAAARGLTLGASDWGLTASGLVEGDTLKKLEEYNPIVSPVVEYGTVLAPLLLSGGTAAGIKAATAAPGLLKTAARLAPPSLISKLGSVVEKAVVKEAKDLGLGKFGGKMALEAAGKISGSAVEATFYGTGQVVSESALGDPDLTAEKALTTIGLSTVLGGALGGAIPLLKPQAAKLPGFLKKSFIKIRGISEETFDRYATRAEKIDSIHAKGETPIQAVSNHANEVLDGVMEAKSKWLGGVVANVNQRIEKAGLNGATRDAGAFFNVIDDEIVKLAPEGTPLIPEQELMIKKLQELKGYIKGVAESNYAKGAKVVESELQLTPKQFNEYRKAFNDAADSWYRSDVIHSDKIARVYKDLGNASRTVLDSIDPQIRKLNKKLADVIEAEQTLKAYGFGKREIKADKFERLFKLGPNKLEDKTFRDSIKTLDEHLSLEVDGKKTRLLDELLDARAVRELNPADAFYHIATGRSAYPMGLGVMMHFVPGLNMIGPIVGTAMAGLQAPVLTKPIIKGATILGSLTKNASKYTAPYMRAISSAFDNGAIPAGAGIWGENISSAIYKEQQALHLGALERAAHKYDQKTDEDLDSIMQEKRSIPTFVAPKSLGVLAKGDKTRDEVYRDRMNAVSEIASNPTLAVDRITRSVEGLRGSAPQVTNGLITASVRLAQFLYSKAPKNPNPPLSNRDWKPSDKELAKWERYWSSAENPLTVVEDMKHGRATSEQIETLRFGWPKLYSDLSQKIINKLTDDKKTLNFHTRAQITKATGIGFDMSGKPSFMRRIQGNFAAAKDQEKQNDKARKGVKFTLSDNTATSTQKAQYK